MEHLRKLRMERNLSQQRLAEEIGAAQQSITKYETGKSEPDFQTLMLLAEFFHTSVDYLIGYTDNPDSHRVLADISNTEAVLKSHLPSPDQLPDPESQIVRDSSFLESTSLYAATPKERHHLMMYRSLSVGQQDSLDKFLEETAPDDSYQKFAKQNDQHP